MIDDGGLSVCHGVSSSLVWMDAVGENDPRYRSLSLSGVSQATNDAMMTPHSHLGMLTKTEKRKRGSRPSHVTWAVPQASTLWNVFRQS